MKNKMAVVSIISILAVTVSCGKKPLLSSEDNKSDSSIVESTTSYDLNENTPLEIRLGYFVYNSAKEMLNVRRTSANLLGGETIVYPFNTIEIVNPYTFRIETPKDIPQIAALTSDDTIEVVVAGVIFDITVHEESMIIFSGEKGIFSCLTNGFELDYDDYNRITYEFSQHKRITPEGVMKYDPDPNLLIHITLYYYELESVSFYDTMVNIVPNSFMRIEDSRVYELMPAE
jgi:hypothetical protein